MTHKMELAGAYAAALAPQAGGDMEAFGKLLSEDFRNLDQDGQVALTREGFLNLGRVMHAAFTDFGFVTSELYEEGEHVIITGHNEGIHTGDLDFSAFGLGVLPASGQKVVWPEASAKLTFSGDKIMQLEPFAGPAGLKAFLAPFGLNAS